MLIKNMFSKDITRDLGGVIKMSQDDKAIIKQELEEYVVTRELQKHFADFFTSYKKSLDGNTDKIGVWISGFFGSGKSHFLKILSYLLENKIVDGKASLDYFIDDNKIADKKVLENMKLATENSSDIILFNIDSISDKNAKDAILSVFLKAFNQHLGYYGTNPFIADLERQLQSENKYEEFKNAILEISGKEWKELVSSYRYSQGQICEALVRIGFMDMDGAKNLFKGFLGTYSFDIQSFAKMVNEHIKQKGNNHHVVFLVDEIGQFIGEDSNLMLNLQTIAEELGSICKGNAWVIVTSQQDIDSITGSTLKIRNDNFSKIQGRFDTRLSLTSANVDEVIKKRILEKTDIARDTLKLLYDEKETIIKNLIVFNDKAEKKLYDNRDDFADVYPFVPYQFNMLANVLNSIRTHGASGKHLSEGERSMLGLFKESAVNIMEKRTSELVSFNLFYNPLENFLDSSHSNVVKRASDNTKINPDKLEYCFDIEVFKTLFLIKYIKEVEANLDNITSLMVSSVDDDRIALREKVKTALDNLVNQTLVEKTGEIYTFLTDEEQEINREIENQNVEISEVMKKISESIFNDFYAESKYKLPVLSGRYSFAFNQSLNDIPFKFNQNHDISLRIITPSSDVGMEEANLRIVSSQTNCVIVAIENDNDFIAEYRKSIKIEKYLRTESSKSVLNAEKIRASKYEEIKKREESARQYLEDSLKRASIYVKGEKLEITSKDIALRIGSGLNNLINRVYYKLEYIDFAANEAHIKSLLKGDLKNVQALDDTTTSANNLALGEMSSYISRNSEKHFKTSIKSLMDYFKMPPFGFIEDDVIWLAAKLFKDGDIAFSMNNEPITLLNKTEDEIYRLLSRKEYTEKLMSEIRKKANERQKKLAKEVYLELFKYQMQTTNDDDLIMSYFQERAREHYNRIKEVEEIFRVESARFKGAHFPGEKNILLGLKLMSEVAAIKNSDSFFEKIEKEYDNYMDFSEDYLPVDNFYKKEQLNIWKNVTEQMQIFEESKLYITNQELEKLVDEINSILKNPNPYASIKHFSGLLDKYTELYLETLEIQAKPVFEDIELARSHVLIEIEGKEYEEKFAQKVFNTFNDLKEKAEKSNNIANLNSLGHQATLVKQRLLSEIIAEVQRLQRLKESEQKRADTSNSTEPPKPAVIEKQKKTISIKNIAAEESWQIENISDIDRYLEGLRKKLRQNIDDKTVLNITF